MNAMDEVLRQMSVMERDHSHARLVVELGRTEELAIRQELHRQLQAGSVVIWNHGVGSYEAPPPTVDDLWPIAQVYGMRVVPVDAESHVRVVPE